LHCVSIFGTKGAFSMSDAKAPFRGRGWRGAPGVVECRPYNFALKPRAQNLRKNATRQENHLWYDFLRTFKPRFTRQRIVGNYILDFFCPQIMLAVELDGSQHLAAEVMAYDKTRTEYLNALGIQVLRFTNFEIDKNFNGVREGINEIVKTMLTIQPPSAAPTPPSVEGGLNNL